MVVSSMKESHSGRKVDLHSKQIVYAYDKDIPMSLYTHISALEFFSTLIASLSSSHAVSIA